MTATSISVWRPLGFGDRVAPFVALALRPLHAVVNAPVVFFLAALTAMLFRPPDLKVFPLDRVAFCALMAVFCVRWCLGRERLTISSITWPMLGLMLLNFLGAVQDPDAAQAWSLLAAKWIVPFGIFHIAGSIFRTPDSLRKLEVFLLATLVYLTLVSVLFLCNGQSLIFPRFIVDEGIGIHADRARGPLLQAVANGVCLNMLGLMALDSFRRGKLKGLGALSLFVCVPLALLATRTRAVWLSTGVTTLYVGLWGKAGRLRKPALALCAVGAIAAAAVWIYQANTQDFADRLMDRSPVDFRLDMYRAGWQMFTEKPLIGWGSEAVIQPEVERRISSFHPERYLFHNTYLELAVERGLLGLGLYAWLIFGLVRLGRVSNLRRSPPAGFMDSQFRRLWPPILLVYFLNASAVVMNYQFVNAVLFTLAGILCAQNQGHKDRLRPMLERAA